MVATAASTTAEGDGGAGDSEERGGAKLQLRKQVDEILNDFFLFIYVKL